MWLSVTVLLLGAAPGQDAGQDVFKSMEQQVLKCKTLQVQLEIAVEPGKDNTIKGRLVVSRDNKMRLDLDGTIKGKPSKMAMVSDGTKMRMIGTGVPGQDQETPTHLSEIARASVSRTGVFVPLFLIVEPGKPGKEPKDFDLDKEFALSDIKLGKKETVSSKEAQVLEYKIATKSAKEPLTVTLWIDAGTNLPLKRVIKAELGQDKFTVTETYTKATLDEKIDYKEFELPK